MPCQWGLQYVKCILCRGIRPPPTHEKGSPGYDTKLYLVVRLQFGVWENVEYPFIAYTARMILTKCAYIYIYIYIERERETFVV